MRTRGCDDRCHHSNAMGGHMAEVRVANGTNTATAPEISLIEGHAGLGVGYASADDVAHVNLDYDAELREKFLGHTIRIEWRYNF